MKEKKKDNIPLKRDFTIRSVNGLKCYINLEENSWKRIPLEQAMMTIIPRAKHGQRDCKKTKEVELEKLEDWVSWKKQTSNGGEEVRARFVTRGYEEECE